MKAGGDNRYPSARGCVSIADSFVGTRAATRLTVSVVNGLHDSRGERYLRRADNGLVTGYARSLPLVHLARCWQARCAVSEPL